MKIILAITFSVILSGCVAIPRGEYYFPSHPVGVARSGSCDHNGNKVNLSITLEEKITLEASLNPAAHDDVILKLGFLIPTGTSVKLSASSISLAIEDSSFFEHEITEWKSLFLVGGQESMMLGTTEIKFAKQYWSDTTINNAYKKRVVVKIPNILIGEKATTIEPIVFEFKSGEWQILPLLNC